MKMYHVHHKTTDGDLMDVGYSRIKYSKLMDVELHILMQLLKLNRGKNGIIYYPIRDVIDYKKYNKILPKTQLNYYKKSVIAYITHDNKVVSWAFLMHNSKDTIDSLCRWYQIKRVNTNKELHFYTQRKHRNKGLATRLIKSIKRKYPNKTFFSTTSESSIFVRNKTIFVKKSN
jgi:GNAT superfamily N-acetyltransferase